MPTPDPILRFSDTQLDVARDTLVRTYGEAAFFRGADVGLRAESTTGAGEVVVRLFVATGQAGCDFDRAGLPSEIAGVPVEVITAGPVSACETRRPEAPCGQPLPQVMGGASLGRLSGATGTAGLLVVDRQSRQVGVLSSWQVLVGATGRFGDVILHPGLADTDISRADQVASLERWTRGTDGDAAFAALLPGQSWLPLQFGSFQPVSSVRAARLGERVYRAGRGTTQAQAIVEGAGIYRVAYEVAPDQVEMRDVRALRLRRLDRDAAAGAGHQGALWAAGSEQAGIGVQFATDDAGQPGAGAVVLVSPMTHVLGCLDLEVACFEPWLSSAAPQEAPTVSPRWGSVEAFLTEYAGGAEAPSPCTGPQAFATAGGLGDQLPDLAQEDDLQQMLPIWVELRAALQDRGFGDDALRISDPVEALQLPAHCAHDAVAETIRRLPVLPMVEGDQLRGAKTFVEVCRLLHDQTPARSGPFGK